jgi:hypothetical protein
VAEALTKCDYGEGLEIDDESGQEVAEDPQPGFERRGGLVEARRRGCVVHS